MNDERRRRPGRASAGSRRDRARVAEAVAAVRELDWRQFVHLVAEAYRAHGYEATVTGDRSDHGIDLVLHKADRTLLVQCKQWRSYAIDREAVRALYGRVMAQRASGGVLLVTGSVLPDAQAFADWAGLQVVDGPAIHDLLYRGRLPKSVRPDAPRTDEPAPAGSHAAQSNAFAAHLAPAERRKSGWLPTFAGLAAVAAIITGIGFVASGMGVLPWPTTHPGAAAPADWASSDAVLQLGGRPVAIAIDGAAKRGYVADFDAGKVVMIDLGTMTKAGKLHAHGGPNAIAVDPDRQVLWLTDFNGARVVAVDIDTGQEVASVKVAKQPDHLAIDADRTRLYVSSRSTTDLQVIDTKSAKKLKPYRTAGSAALAIDSDNRLLYVSERDTGRIQVYDFETKQWDASTSCDATVTGMAVDGARQRLYTIGDSDWVEEADLVARVKNRHQLDVPARAIAIDGDRGYVLDPESATLRSFPLR